MGETKVVNLYREEFDVYIGRSGKGQSGYFGNQIPLTNKKDRDLVLEKYSAYFYERIENDPEFKQRVLDLKGKRLGCFCRPDGGFKGKVRCHGQIIAAFCDGVQPEDIP